MDRGREHNNITRLYREGSSEEKMCKKLREQRLSMDNAYKMSLDYFKNG